MNIEVRNAQQIIDDAERSGDWAEVYTRFVDICHELTDAQQASFDRWLERRIVQGDAR